MRLLVTAVAALGVSLAFAIVYPDIAIKPGELSQGHANLKRDCLRCHTMWGGATEANCISCHKLTDIGRVTTAGVLLPVSEKPRALFHQSLSNTDCSACHVIHATERARRTPVKFQHDFLNPDLRKGCSACHSGQRPRDSLHLQVTAQCSTCHSTSAWRPATFEHDRYFRFDRNHPAKCDACHTTPDFKEYTCYRCHEHSPQRIAAEHLEEGIRNFEQCARCHRTGNAEESEREGREGGRGGRSEREDEDRD